MSVINLNEAAKTWKAHRKEPSAQLYLSGSDGDAGELLNARIAGFSVALNILPLADSIDPEDLAGAAAAVVQVDPGIPASIERFEKLSAATKTPLIAAAYEPPLALVRALVRAGAHDVVPLPLDISDLETSLMPIREAIGRENQENRAASGKVVSVIKSVGGIGATALLTQLGIRAAQNEAAHGRQVCLLDLDLQFGNAAFLLGLRPSLSFADLLEAGARLDGELLRAVATAHSSGLRVIGAPQHMMPLETVTSEQLLEIIDIAKREFGTILVDLPSNWTNWSLSLLAQSDLVLLLTELSVNGLHRASRQLDLIREQDLGALDVRIVVNRFEKGILKAIRPADVQDTLGRSIAYTIANDPAVMREAAERGVPIADIKRKSAVGKDIDVLDAGIAGALGRER